MNEEQTKLEKITPALQKAGAIPNIRTMFINFQQHLYQA